METGLLHDIFWEFFPCEVKNIIFAWRGACKMRLNPCEVRMTIKMNIPARGECGPDGGLYLVSHLLYLVSHLPYLVSHLPYLVCHPLSGIPSPLSGIPSPYLVCHPLSGIPSPLSGIPSPIWYPISPIWYLILYLVSHPITSHQSGILHSLIIFFAIEIAGNLQI